jgi:nicotinamide mononucleotide transporter
VWLAVRGSALTWPVGIANNAVFFVLFLDARLFADMALQVVYAVLAVGGWWYWLRGGPSRTVRPVARVASTEALAVALVTAITTWGLTEYLRSIGDAAPFLDALTTCGSLAATYLMARRLLECWWVWIAVDVVYVPLYLSRDLPLTALLYGLFLVMCLRGVLEWRRSIPASAPVPQAA